ncbi:UDP-glucose dehydrogenase family protein [Pontibacillus litoralis]|uniref:UDP-glucose 6-dehydrogenase n=1 Tax=Pontibacillus litoralis JSM 072002 TaxID=1385512 RepID=A0A0A5G7X9_9BACI|nr:UDP-glucose/GDP-mannose dehydrogenase family protein [Pontibacillus litoralis]KGX87210.1 UDP-glucose 6-dehydrogenase [Pontibacillus litoralis JSM 072002]
MDIAVIGAGYVGLVTGVCLSDLGNQVTCIDINEEKVAMLKRGESPIYEEGLTELLQKNIQRGNLDFTTQYREGLANKRVIYIAVDTPQLEDGSANLTYINKATASIAEHLDHDAIIVTKSTVPMGTNEYIKERMESLLTHDITIKIASNPEFLRQGSAVYDTFNGDRIVIGSDDEEAMRVLTEINEGFNLPIVQTDLRSAEMIKYASNAFLATKISFINEIANLSEKTGANIQHVAKGMGMDKRIGSAFLNAGIGYGGSCFPKDTNALLSIGEQVNYSMPILKNTVYTNERQKGIIVDKMLERFDSLEGKKIAILGVAFKPNTDDMREAPSILITKRLLEEGANLRAYDPVATVNAKTILSEEIEFTTSVDEAVKGADVAVILTEWEDIKHYPLEKYKQHLSHPILFDGRNCFTVDEVKGQGVEYHSIGRPTIQA